MGVQMALQTNPRQKQWSDHDYFFPQLQLSHINKGSAVLTLDISKRSPMSQEN